MITQTFLIPPSKVHVADRMRALDQGHVADMAQSIEKYGQLQPIIVDDDDNLIIGAHRHAACVELDSQVLACRYSHLSDADKQELELEENIRRKDLSWQDRALGIAKTHATHKRQAALKGESWTFEHTAESLRMTTSHVYNMITVGLKLADDEELAKQPTFFDAVKLLIARKERQATQELAKRTLAPTAPLVSNVMPAPDYLADESQASPQVLVQLSQLHQLGDFRTVYAGHVEFVDHIVCDPPYAIDMDNILQDTTSVDATHQVASNMKLLADLVQNAAIWLRPNGYLIMWCDTMHFAWLHEIGERADFRVQRWPLVWVKTSRCHNQAAKYNFTKATELAIVMRKKDATLVKPAANNWIICGNDATADHPFAKPREVWDFIYSHIAISGQTVLDPCAGSGSSVLAALHNNLQPISCEIDEVHLAEMHTQLKAHYTKAFGEGNVRFV